ncbi:N-acetylmuramoyl-L-alanine amidase [Fictibacillus sp. Mic-4]|uniref:N-acetylmuramoyl-L-alanine amidase n=1 Tax=Fictibacillus sp. Mic-4 TaxID=3132826 RepID=UPI003CF920C6
MSFNVIADYVKINQYTRPGMKRSATKAIVMHYTATPGASAKNERDYFNGTCIADQRYASAHYFVDDDEARLIMPEDEVAYHAHDNNRCYIAKLNGNANLTAIGVEMCIDRAGRITEKTFENTAQLVAQLLKKYGLDPNDIYRHYDITGKNCPAPWVSDTSQFSKFKNRVSEIISGSAKPASKPVVKEAQKKTFRIRVKASTLWYYNKPNWDAKKDTVKKGDVYTVVDTLTVAGSKMYKLKSGNYITANSKYVEVLK